jgi:hypothetical protein
LKTGAGFWFPSSLVFSFTVDRSLIPKRFNDTGHSESKEKTKYSEEPESGKVYLNYSNYRVNKGLPDELFDEKDKKK